MALLIVFAGLPGTGKTTIARELARQCGAMFLRVDSIGSAAAATHRAPGTLFDPR